MKLCAKKKVRSEEKRSDLKKGEVRSKGKRLEDLKKRGQI
jgi:hypothetical protein